MLNLGYNAFLRKYHQLLQTIDSHRGEVETLMLELQESCICADENEFQDMLDSYEDLMNHYSDLLFDFEWFRSRVFRAYCTTPQGVKE